MRYARRLSRADFRTTVLLLAFGCLSLLAGVGGCARGAQQTSAARPTGAPAAQATVNDKWVDAAQGKVVGVSLLTRQHVFYKDLEAGLKDTAALYRIDLRVQAAEFKADVQASQIENFLVQKVNALIVCPVDSASVGAAVKQANQAGIPVFTADIASKSGAVVSHIASDNVLGGRKAGEALVQLLGGKGSVIIIDNPEVTSVQDRVRGFREEIEKHPAIKIIGAPDALGQRAKAVTVMEDMLVRHPDVNGVFGINDDSALGALQAIEAAGAENIVVVGYDATPEARQRILRGSALKADVVQNPRLIGRRTIETICAYWSGEKVDKVIPIPVDIVDAEGLKREQS